MEETRPEEGLRLSTLGLRLLGVRVIWSRGNGTGIPFSFYSVQLQKGKVMRSFFRPFWFLGRNFKSKVGGLGVPDNLYLHLVGVKFF